jgi:hypothetical protein
MKNLNKSNWTVLLTTLVMAFVFSSCQKAVIEDQTFDDVFDTSQIEDLNSLLRSSATLDDLPVEFSEANITIPEEVENLQITELVSYLEDKNSISDSEVDLLLQNDIDTYILVVERLGSLPGLLEEMNLKTEEIQNSTLNKYQLIQVQELNEYYTNDYYHAALELQSYMNQNVIQPLKNLNTLAENTVALKSAGSIQDNNKNNKSIQAIIVSILKDIKELLKKIEKDCKDKKDKKHKGSKGDDH